ncbi:acetyltransferase [Acinetobacter wanghuae]|uniref:acetyltransferase n=1 Tax=Acinetobacter wanghuae TaxID=2662362 RepID=UPI003AF62F63
MRDLIIIGAGGLGKEISWLSKRCGRNIVGFLDDTLDKQGTIINSDKVLGNIADCVKYKNCDFIIAIGNPRARKKIIETYFDDSYNFATLIDPSVIISEYVDIKPGVVICAGVILTIDIKVGRHTIINLNATVGHDVTIGDYVTIAPNVAISGEIEIGNLVELGTNSTLKEKLTISNGAMIGMGAVVTRNVEMNNIVIGSPAKLLRIIND